ncbi:MAG TPA: LLM class flavin-dependent oxidoreductase [Candidatus Binataceae bacterium]|nr:LLM class flavin-dependent oxidoreductase [Candidatus Binataceae bacterium]
MLFGVFDHMDRSGTELAAQYKDRLTLLEAYDRAGFRGYHIAEHHCTPLGLSPSPSVFLAAASQRTRKIRLGTLVYTLSLYHPLRLLEEICMLDCLTGGRLDVGIGRGISPIELGFYGVESRQSQELYIEASEILLQGLISRRLTFEGKHFTFRDVPIEMSTVQKPRPPLWYGVAHADTAQWAARNKVNIVCSGDAASVAAVTGRFKSEWLACGNSLDAMPLAGLSRHVVVAETDAEARATAKGAYEQWYENLTYLWRLNNLQIPVSFPPIFEEADEAGFCLVGSPATVRDKLSAQAQEAGVSYILCRMAFGNLTIEQSLRTVELMRSEVMPAFDKSSQAA